MAAIFLPTMPDLPMPVTITRPPQRDMRSTARAKLSPTRAATASIARASTLSTRLASSGRSRFSFIFAFIYLTL